jgi:hypothetical protein
MIEEYKNPQVTQDQIYVIEKVAKMRALQGRYGVDHSEILNYEFEQANKERLDCMNRLVYKNSTITSGNPAFDSLNQSQAIFERLTDKEINE